MKNYRSRKHCLLLYPNEDKSHKNALEYIKHNYDYAYIVHDKDLKQLDNDEFELKKQHVHVVISFSNAKWNTSIASELGIELNYIQECRNFDKALDYLIHFNDDTKYQYSIEEVHGNLKSKLEKIIRNENKDENEKSFELITYIENFKGTLTIKNFARYCAEIGMWDIFRRASVIYLEMIKEHNFLYSTTSDNYNLRKHERK